MLPLTDHQLERQAMIVRLKELKVLIAGWDFPASHPHYIENSWIKDIWQQEEHLEAAKLSKQSKVTQIPTRPDPAAVKEVLGWMRKNRKHTADGTKEYY